MILGIAYPPSDTSVLTWLTADSTSRDNTYRRCCAFLQALFEHTLKVIDNDFLQIPSQKSEDVTTKWDIPTIASKFREKMQEGAKYASHGAYRLRFYADVIAEATKLYNVSFLPIAPLN